MPSKKRKHAQESVTRAELEARHGRVWDTREFAREFVVLAVIDDQLVVRQRSDATVGKITYSNSPRYYFHFEPAETENAPLQPASGKPHPERGRGG